MNEVIKRLKEQNPQAQPKKIKPEPVKEEIKIPSPEEISQYENEDGEVINDFEEEEVEENGQKQAPQLPPESKKPVEQSNNTGQIAELMRDLQDNGIFRLRLLAILERMSASYDNIDKNIKSLCDYFALQHGK